MACNNTKSRQKNKKNKHERSIGKLEKIRFKYRLHELKLEND